MKENNNKITFGLGLHQERTYRNLILNHKTLNKDGRQKIITRNKLRNDNNPEKYDQAIIDLMSSDKLKITFPNSEKKQDIHYPYVGKDGKGGFLLQNKKNPINKFMLIPEIKRMNDKTLLEQEEINKIITKKSLSTKKKINVLMEKESLTRFYDKLTKDKNDFDEFKQKVNESKEMPFKIIKGISEKIIEQTLFKLKSSKKRRRVFNQLKKIGYSDKEIFIAWVEMGIVPKP